MRPRLVIGLAAPIALACGIAVVRGQPAPGPPGTVGPAPPGGTSTSEFVRLDGKSLVDRGGPFLALGASYFQALRRAKFDRPRLESDLAFLASKKFNYVRILSMVGWEGLEIAPVEFRGRDGRTVAAWPDYWQHLRDLINLAFSHGLRTQITVFADAQDVMPDKAARIAHMKSLLENLAGREYKIILIEVANEAWQNGFPGVQGVADLREFTEYLAARTRIPIAISSNHGGDENWLESLHRGTAADVATVHFSRDLRTDERGWLPVRDCYEAAGLPGLPPLSSNEPIGPGSSVATENDPIKLVMAAAFAWTAGLPMYVFHSKAGVAGRETFQSMAGVGDFVHLLKILPPDLAGWVRHDGREATAPFTTYADDQPNKWWPEIPAAKSGAVRNTGATKGREFVALPIGILKAGVTLQARHPVAFRVYHPLTGEVVSRHALSAGQRLTLPPGPGAYILRGLIE